MQAAETTSGPEFAGAAEEQQIAREIFQVMRAMGRFFSPTAPIRVSVSSLADFLASRSNDRSADEWAIVIEETAARNPGVFAREERDGQALLVSTLQGRAPTEQAADIEHGLARRFQEPVPRPAVAPAPRRVVAPALPVEEPPAAIVAEPEREPIEVEEPVAEEPEVPIIQEPMAQPEPVVEVDLATVDDATLARAISEELRTDLSVANFGQLWLAEDKTPRLSRGDLRRIREYLLERNEPLSDDTLLQDVLGIRPGADNYDVMRFALDFRLSRETREFEFVGSSDQRLWSTTGLPAIGTTKRKPSELGQDYRFLLDEPSAQPLEQGVVEHVLTFYEYQYGVLPYAGEFQSLFPSPLLPDQRAAVLAFESPQTHENFFVELRYPTGNRGGYVAGLERFFLENLVPGALVTIEQSGNSGRYLIEYLPVSGEDRKLLQLDEKRNRYVFRPMTFYCATQEGMVLSENRFPQFVNATPLDERARRRPEQVLAQTFERVGEQVGSATESRFMAVIDDLYVASNVERPMSLALIRRIATSGEYAGFSPDPDVEDVYYYQPTE